MVGWHWKMVLVAMLLGGAQAVADDGTETVSIRWQGDDAPMHAKIERHLREQRDHLMESLSPEAKRGYLHLVESVYLPSDFDQEIVDEIERQGNRGMDFLDGRVERGSPFWSRFGLTARPDQPSKPMQYVVTEEGKYVMNCFACHGGSLYGVSYPGLPNNLYALESLTEQVRRVKLSMNKPLGHMDVGSMAMPLGTSVGTSNAVMFGVALMNYRDADLNIYPLRTPAYLVNHDMDAPPWWHFAKKSHLYIDGFAEKGHRGLMQFMMVKQNGPKQFQGWEGDFRDVYTFLQELKAPRFPLDIDSEKASRGKIVYEQRCAVCHGTYGARGDYPERVIAISEVGTDPIRHQALTTRHRESYARSWFADYGKQDTKVDVDGYVAPPLDGIWASAPYFHNGSVPTLWHVLHPEARPAVWKRTHLGMDWQRMGLKVEEFDAVPSKLNAEQRRWYFDSRQTGKSNRGHDFPSSLEESQKIDLLEYLKTL